MWGRKKTLQHEHVCFSLLWLVMPYMLTRFSHVCNESVHNNIIIMMVSALRWNIDMNHSFLFPIYKGGPLFEYILTFGKLLTTIPTSSVTPLKCPIDSINSIHKTPQQQNSMHGYSHYILSLYIWVTYLKYSCSPSYDDLFISYIHGSSPSASVRMIYAW